MECTDRNNRVMQLAKQLAKERKDSHVGSGHLLYGLGKESAGMGHYILSYYEITPEMIAAELDKLTQKEECTYDPVFTPRLELIFQYAEEEATALGHTKVGPEHFFLGVLREGQSVATQILTKLGLAQTDLKKHILETLGFYDRKFKLNKVEDNTYLIILVENDKEETVGRYCIDSHELLLNRAMDVNEITRIIETIRKGIKHVVDSSDG